MAVVTMRQLLDSGVHFGHQTRRWNPKMKRFIFTERNGIHIIDLQASLGYIDSAYEFVSETVAHGGTILFIGTKKQAQEAVSQQAARVGMPYVSNRWLGGMLTNFSTVHQRLERLKELEEIDFDDVAGSRLTKKELLKLRRQKDKLERTLGGIRNMEKVPSAVWIVDTNKEHIAVAEARKLGIPIIAILDTNCDPDDVDYPVPGNDDAIRAVSVLTRVMADAVANGLVARSAAADKSEESEPMAAWEREVLDSGADTEVVVEEVVVESVETADPKAVAAESAESPTDENATGPAADPGDQEMAVEAEKAMVATEEIGEDAKTDDTADSPTPDVGSGAEASDEASKTPTESATE